MQFIQTRRYQRPHAPPLLAHARPRPGTKNYWLPFRCTVIAVASVHRPAASFHPLVATLSSVHAVHQLDTIRNVSTCAVTFSLSLSLSLSRFNPFSSRWLAFDRRRARKSFLSTKTLRQGRFITNVRQKVDGGFFKGKSAPQPEAYTSLLLYEIFMTGR